jgi:uncharacterized RDD family membrane protein YckC
MTTTTTSVSTTPHDAGPAAGPVPAGLDRRFYAFVLDRLLLWSLYAAASAAGYAWFLRDERWPAGIAIIGGAVLLLSLVSAVAQGLWGVSAGKAALGVRVLGADDGRPIGVPRALLRALVLGVATLPTFGFGAAALAWTAVADPGGRRRGWHDLRAGSVVVDVRPPEEPEVEAADEPHPVVNLTAMRLVPPSPTPPARPPALPPDAAPPGRRARRAARWRVTFDTGEELDVEGLVLVGRGPEPRAGEPVGMLLALSSSDMSLSKTHAQFQVVPDGALVVMDRGSTNGSVLVRGGLVKLLEGGRPATLKHGDRVRFGDREMTVARLDSLPQ